jgi:hypothetical protein
MSLSAKARIPAVVMMPAAYVLQVPSRSSCFPGSIRHGLFVLLRINAKRAMMGPRHGRHDGDKADAAKSS